MLAVSDPVAVLAEIHPDSSRSSAPKTSRQEPVEAGERDLHHCEHF